MKYPFLVTVAAIIVSACGDKKPAIVSSVTSKKDNVAGLKQDSATAPKPKQYFPVMSFIKSEIAYVDSLPVGIKKYSSDNKNKYVYIKPEEFHRLAAEFIPKEIADSTFTKQYQETSFFDQTSNSATFYYTTKNDTLPVKRVDVLTEKGDVYDKIKSIYLQKNYRSGDTFFLKKLYWKPQKSFQIITETAKGSGQPVTKIINVVWDNTEE